MATLKKLSIYTSEGSRFGSRPLHSAIISTALQQGVYSAITVKAIAGFGPQMAIPTTNQMALTSDLPIEVRLIDYASVIEPFLANYQEMLATCLVTLEDIEVVQSPIQSGGSSLSSEPDRVNNANPDA